MGRRFAISCLLVLLLPIGCRKSAVGSGKPDASAAAPVPSASVLGPALGAHAKERPFDANRWRAILREAQVNVPGAGPTGLPDEAGSSFVLGPDGVLRAVAENDTQLTPRPWPLSTAVPPVESEMCQLDQTCPRASIAVDGRTPFQKLIEVVQRPDRAVGFQLQLVATRKGAEESDQVIATPMPFDRSWTEEGHALPLQGIAFKDTEGVYLLIDEGKTGRLFESGTPRGFVPLPMGDEEGARKEREGVLRRLADRHPAPAVVWFPENGIPTDQAIMRRTHLSGSCATTTSSAVRIQWRTGGRRSDAEKLASGLEASSAEALFGPERSDNPSRVHLTIAAKGNRCVAPVSMRLPRLQRSIERCIERVSQNGAGGSGQARFELALKPNDRAVARVEEQGGSIAAPVVECVLKSFEVYRFDAWSDERVSLEVRVDGSSAGTAISK